jgi:hypothetical protein
MKASKTLRENINKGAIKCKNEVETSAKTRRKRITNRLQEKCLELLLEPLPDFGPAELVRLRETAIFNGETIVVAANTATFAAATVAATFAAATVAATFAAATVAATAVARCVFGASSSVFVEDETSEEMNGNRNLEVAELGV